MDNKYKNNLKIYAGKAVVESKLSKESKRQLLKFIQHEASEFQVMALILDGKITKLDEQSNKVVEDRFNCSKFHEVVNEIIGHVVALGVWASGPALAAFAVKMYNRYLKQSARACLKYKGNENTICQLNFKIKAAEKTLKELVSFSPKCKTPKAKERLKKEIEKWNEKIDNLKIKLAKAK